MPATLTRPLTFVAGGDNVVITQRSGEPPEGLTAVRCEVTDSASVDAAFTECRPHTPDYARHVAVAHY